MRRTASSSKMCHPSLPQPLANKSSMESCLLLRGMLGCWSCMGCWSCWGCWSCLGCWSCSTRTAGRASDAGRFRTAGGFRAAGRFRTAGRAWDAGRFRTAGRARDAGRFRHAGVLASSSECLMILRLRSGSLMGWAVHKTRPPPGRRKAGARSTRAVCFHVFLFTGRSSKTYESRQLGRAGANHEVTRHVYENRPPPARPLYSFLRTATANTTQPFRS